MATTNQCLISHVHCRNLEYLLAYPKIPGEDTIDGIEEEAGTVKDTFLSIFQVC